MNTSTGSMWLALLASRDGDEMLARQITGGRLGAASRQERLRAATLSRVRITRDTARRSQPRQRTFTEMIDGGTIEEYVAAGFDRPAPRGLSAAARQSRLSVLGARRTP